MIGKTVAHYEITGRLGAGGMGEVFRARDTKLKRDVAIKILPEAFAKDEDRMKRFEREAQLLASLNHPNIAAIYGVEQNALVLELVEGSTLAERLHDGPLSLDEAVTVARQLADGIEAAHDRGVVHRDLKPANVKLSPDGHVKILDFGLAKGLEASNPDGERESDPSSPTLTRAATAAGMLLGTAAYMSPEQAKGKPVDGRADVWGFGCILFELLTGERAFRGDGVSETLAFVLTRDVDWSLLPESTPQALRRVLRRCLQRDVKKRMRNLGDVRIELEEMEETPELSAASPASTSTEPPPSSSRSVPVVAAFVAGSLIAGLSIWLSRGEKPRAPGAMRLALPGANLVVDPFVSVALSRDGQSLVYRGRDDDGTPRLYLQSFRSFEVEAVKGTEGASLPFFSPDGRWVGFFADGALNKIPVEGGVKQPLAPAGTAGGGAWLHDGTIVYVDDTSSGLKKVPAAGGEPGLVLGLDRDKGESLITSPSPLPSGRTILCSVRVGTRFDIAVVSLDEPEPEFRILAEDGFSPIYVPTGHIIYQQGEGAALLALPFDPERLSVLGPPESVLPGVLGRISMQSRSFDVANNGTVVYMPQASDLNRGELVWIDQNGRTSPVLELDRRIDLPKLSPDGTRVAFRTPAPSCDVWVHDLARGTTVRVTFEGDNHGVAWQPDGAAIAFANDDESLEADVFMTAADGTGIKERLLTTEDPYPLVPSSFSPDGRYVLLAARGDIAIVDLEEGGVPTPLIDSRFNEFQPSFSPDGRFISYASDQSGRIEVFVQPLPSLDRRLQISTQGGREPVWSRDGTELFFLHGQTLMAVDVSIGDSGELSAGVPHPLFDGEFFVGSFDSFVTSYDVAEDGRFLVARSLEPSSAVGFHLVLDWFDELTALSPAN